MITNRKTTEVNLRKKTQTRVVANRRPQTRNKITTLSKISLNVVIFFVPRGEIYTWIIFVLNISNMVPFF